MLKKSLLFICISLLTVATSSGSLRSQSTVKAFGSGLEAVRPEAPAKRSVAVAKTADMRLETIFSEDFSRFEAGSEETPDDVDLTKGGSAYIPDEYTANSGWWGVGVYQAGGVCALCYPYRGGVLTSPMADMSGRLVVRCKAKSVSGQALLMFNVLYGSPEAPQPAAENAQIFLDSEDGWQPLEFIIENYYKGDDCYVQFNAMTYNNGVMLDDVEICRDLNYVERPTGLTAEAFVNDGFTARWKGVEGASGYLVDVYEDRPTGAPAVNVKETFDNIDITNPVWPEGWNVSTAGTPVVVNPADKSQAFLFSGNDDVLEFPEHEGIITSLAFSAWRAPEADQNSMACVMLYGLDKATSTWMPVMYFYAADLDADGSRIDLGDAISGYYSALKFGCYYFESETDGIMIDDLTYSVDAPVERVKVRSGLESGETSLAITGLEPANDHWFAVATRTTSATSEYSNQVLAFGVASPAILEATEINPAAKTFTANWTPVAKATSYIVDLFEGATVEADQPDAEVIADDFSGVKSSATPDDATLIGDIDYMSLDEYTAVPGWMGSGVVIADGMLGCYHSSLYDLELVSPIIDLHNNDGRFTVTMDAWAKEGTTLVVQSVNGYAVHEFKSTGIENINMTIDGGISRDRLMIYTMGGETFLLDNIAVTQSRKAGDMVLEYVSSVPVDGNNSSLQADMDTPVGAYTVTSVYKRYREECQSAASLPMYLDMSAGVSKTTVADATITVEGGCVTVTSDEGVKVEVFSVDGRLVALGDTAGGSCTLCIGNSGIYVVRYGDNISKVYVK